MKTGTTMTDEMKNTTNTTISATRRALVSGAALGAAALALNPGVKATAQNGKKLGGEFENKVVLITGATSGIGKATAKAFAKEGATVAFCGRRENLGKSVQKEIRDTGGRASYSKVDVRDRKALKHFIDDTAKQYGRIDIAYNNAGIAIPTTPIEEVDDKQFDDIMATNISGPFWSMAYELKHMKPAGKGVIINTSSVFGPHAADNQAAYGATRSAVNAMIEAVAKEAGPKGVRVVGIAPGAVPDTDLFRFMGRDWNADEKAYMASLAGLGRVGKPEDIAHMVLALASEKASFVHGTTLPVDGQFLNA